MDELTETEKAMLQLERSWWQYPGTKEEVVRERFGLSMTGYYQSLNGLIGREAALAWDPLGVKRLRRMRDERAASRSGRRLGFA